MLIAEEYSAHAEWMRAHRPFNALRELSTIESVVCMCVGMRAESRGKAWQKPLF